MTLVWIGIAVAALALIAVAAAAGPLQRFFRLREDVRTRLRDLATVLAAAQADSKAALEEAQHVFNELGILMSGFARRGVATLSIRGMGFDPAAAASSLIGFSNALPAYGIERLRWRAQVERALKIQNDDGGARMRRSRLNPVFVVLALIAIAFAARTYMSNRHLQHALKTAHIMRVVIEKDTKRTRERAGEAEQAKVAAEQSLTDVRAQLAEVRKAQAASERALGDASAQLVLTRKAKVAAEQSLEKVREDLVAAESAHKSSEQQLKALSDELGAVKTAKDDAERSLKAANDQLALLKSAKEASDADAAKAKEDLERERKAREAAEQAPPAAAPRPAP
jgi:hypothetical protein